MRLKPDAHYAPTNTVEEDMAEYAKRYDALVAKLKEIDPEIRWFLADLLREFTPNMVVKDDELRRGALWVCTLLEVETIKSTNKAS